MHRSRASVATPNASRYLQQLCKHWSHKFATDFDPRRGTIDMGEGRAVAMEAGDEGLSIVVAVADPAALPRLETVVADHVRRFAFREESTGGPSPADRQIAPRFPMGLSVAAREDRAWTYVSPPRASLLAPLRNPTFRAIWLASLASNFGGLIQAVGAAWLMTSLTASADMVALVQASTTLPIMVFSLAAGAIADNFDRRQVMLAAQVFMLASRSR